ncbi:hypothetical protein HELRODRAFT_166769 [Helobdella robusta]|uniref:Uncharacterized protein n=1 Tax=Helobdella robusta TaxID=6412 RepID=T1EYI1_HELRO|nr:hypothetical protein HELRODRAFT_166769 [Helobdella robusta]ESO11744.1 hypothetical protein HELRODRAFT_166769 [Helobdella robusta]
MNELNKDIKQEIDAIKTVMDEGDSKPLKMDASGSKLCDEISVLKREMNRSSFSEVVKSEIFEVKEMEANMILFGLKEGSDDGDKVHKIINYLTDGVFGLKNVLKVISVYILTNVQVIGGI